MPNSPFLSHFRVQAYADFLPWFGLGLGTACAIFSLWLAPITTPPDGVAAQVNDRAIRMQDWAMAIAAANDARREPLDAEAKQAVLHKLIDEELLLQFAEDLGLASQLPTIRNGLTQAAMQALVAEPDQQPDPEALRQFYAQHSQLFRREETRVVQAWRYASEADAQQQVAGEALTIPASAHNRLQLARWVGGGLAEAAFGLPQAGALSAPLAVGQGWYRLQLLRIEAATTPEFTAIDPEALQRQWQRFERERRLQQQLATLREAARILLTDQSAP